MERGDVDVGAARLGEALVPARPQPRKPRLERAPVEPLERDLGAGELRRERGERRPARRVGDMDRAARAAGSRRRSAGRDALVSGWISGPP